MAKQTINIGASPNDGTGTPLRTSFDYCNLNFTELYTAVGPSGNNIVVPGTATITGALTVDTTTLVVDPTNNRVGIGTASPAAGYSLDILGAAVGGVRVRANDYPGLTVDSSNSNGVMIYLQEGGVTQARIGHLTSVTGLEFSGNNGAFATNVHYGIDATGISTWKNVGGVAGTAMTLNSTGLGVGIVPSAARFEVGGQDGTQFYIRSTGTNPARIRGFTNATEAGLIGFLNGGGIYFDVSGERMRIDTSGNVGIGVTPLYKFHAAVTSGAVGAFRATTAAIARLLVGNTVEDVELKVNANGDGQLTANASKYLGLGSNGLNDRVILDTTGNLLVGTTNTSATAGPGFKSQFSSTVPQFAIVVNEAGTSSSLSIYNVSAAAYRFYVNNGGTVFATNTTISAISDARLKENVQDIDVGLGAILALKPRKFDWKAGKGKDIKGDRGFIAQEFETVFPNLIDEWADPAPEGEAPYKSVRQDLIPVLVKAIQELTARVQTLEAR